MSLLDITQETIRRKRYQLNFGRPHTTCSCMLVEIFVFNRGRGTRQKKCHRRLSFTSVWSLPAATLTSASVVETDLGSFKSTKTKHRTGIQQNDQCIPGCQSEHKTFKTKHDPNIEFQLKLISLLIAQKQKISRKAWSQHDSRPASDEVVALWNIEAQLQRGCVLHILRWMDVFHQDSFGGFGGWVMLSPPRNLGILRSYLWW